MDEEKLFCLIRAECQKNNKNSFLRCQPKILTFDNSTNSLVVPENYNFPQLAVV